MMWLFDSIRGRVVVVLIVFLSLSHLGSLSLYAQRSEEAATLLHDALLAEQIALMARVVERLPSTERRHMLETLSGPIVRMAEANSADLRQDPPEGSRAHAFEHLLGVFLDRPTHDSMRIAYSTDSRLTGIQTLLGTVRSSAHSEADHLPPIPLNDIRPVGAVVAEIALSDGSWLRFAAPLLTVTPFSPWKLGGPLAAMLASILLIAAWILHRWTEPVSHFVAAAERLGTNIHASPLTERGPFEIRVGARAFNLMQARIRRLVEDRTAFAAAIAHDLGTPITRLHLRAHEIEEESTRSHILADLEQMRRMISATLEFARLEFAAEPAELVDLASLVQSLCDDYFDAGQQVLVGELVPVTIASKPIALRRALGNLLENAFKYGARARVALAATPHHVHITIDDDGPGIPPEMVEEAFRPFRRLPPRSGDAGAGTGLGLSIARSVVRGLGGEITLANHANGGLEVTVILPRPGTSGRMAHPGNQEVVRQAHIAA